MALDSNGLSLLWDRMRAFVAAYCQRIQVPNATTSQPGKVKPDGTTITVDQDGTIHGSSSYVLPAATTSDLGGVKPDGTTITVDGDGTIHGSSNYTLPVATTSTLGGVIPDGTTITVDQDGTIRASGEYVLPVATNFSLGIVKADGTTILVDGDGTISAYFGLDPASTSVLGGVMVDGTTITADTDGTIHAESYVLPAATTSDLGGVIPDGTTITVDSDGTIHGTSQTPVATASTAGKVRPDGTTITVDQDGTIHGPGATRPGKLGTVMADNVSIVSESGILSAVVPVATEWKLGGVIPDGTTIAVDSSGMISTVVATPVRLGTVMPDNKTITVSSGVLSARQYVLRAATTDALGGVKAGDGVTIGPDGTLSVNYVIPDAGEDVTGGVRYDGVTIKRNESGQLYVDIAYIASAMAAGDYVSGDMLVLGSGSVTGDMLSAGTSVEDGMLII